MAVLGVGQTQQNFQNLLQGFQILQQGIAQHRRNLEYNFDQQYKTLQDEIKTGYGGSWRNFLDYTAPDGSQPNREAFGILMTGIMGKDKADALVQGITSGLVSPQEMEQRIRTEFVNGIIQYVDQKPSQNQQGQNVSMQQQGAGGRQQQIALPGQAVGQSGAPQPQGPSPRNLAGTQTESVPAQYTGVPPLSPGDARGIAPGQVPPGAPGDTRTISQPPLGTYTPGGTVTRTVNDQSAAPPAGVENLPVTINTGGTNVNDTAVAVDQQFGKVYGFDPAMMPNQTVDRSVTVSNGKATFNPQVYDAAHGQGAAARFEQQLQAKGTTIQDLVQNRFDAIEASKKGEKTFTIGGNSMAVDQNLPAGSSGGKSQTSASGGMEAQGSFADFQKQIFGERGAAVLNTPIGDMTHREKIEAKRAIDQGTRWAINQTRRQKLGGYSQVQDADIIRMMNDAQVSGGPMGNILAASAVSGMTPAQEKQMMEAKRQHESLLKRQDFQLYLQARSQSLDEWYKQAIIATEVAKAAAGGNATLKPVLDTYAKMVSDFENAMVKKYGPEDGRRRIAQFYAEKPNDPITKARDAMIKLTTDMAPKSLHAAVSAVMHHNWFGPIQWESSIPGKNQIVVPGASFPGSGGQAGPQTAQDQTANDLKKKY